MQVKILRGKIHRATVTEANIDYEGSITLDASLMEAANIVPHQEVEVWDVTNGERLQTYAVPGAPHSGTVCINGAAARRIHLGDLVIVAAYGWLDDRLVAATYEPSIVHVDERNHRVERLRSVAV
jgi:aspartate 1-decarboxylase